MGELIVQNSNELATLDDLSKFVLIGREKLNAVRAEIRAIQKLGLAEEVRSQKLSEAQDIAEAVLDAEVRIGELMTQLPTSSGKRTDLEPQSNGGPRLEDEDSWDDILEDEPKTKGEAIEELGFSKTQAKRFETLAKNPEIVARAKAEARENDDIVSRSLALNMIKAENKKAEILEAEKSIHEQADDSYKPYLTVGNGIGFKPEEKYDLLLTDPPYSTDVDNIDSFVDSWLYNALDCVKDTGFAYVFIGAYPNEVKAYLNAAVPEHIRLEQNLIWTYRNTLGNNPKDRYKQNYQVCLFFRGVNAPALDCPLTNEQWAVQDVNAPDGRLGDRYHAWQKPMELAERFIRHTTKQGMTVFDPFACTGTFLLAATKLGRKAYGFEINPEHAQIAFSRGCVARE